MKKINIFIASSIVEFQTERMAIENFIRNVSDKFEEHYNIKLQPLLCENFDDAFTVERKQDEYNKKIKNSELCFFIFFTKAGEYTLEEFEVARKKFEETGKPRIYTYFKIIEDGKAEQSLYDFMNTLDKTLGHYYGTFEHLDTVKLRILLSIKLEEMDFLEIKTEEGKLVVDGTEVMPLNNVAEFINNKHLQKLQNELEATEKAYYEMKPIYAKGNCDSMFYRKYSDCAAKRENLIREIEELQRLIFNISLRIVKDAGRGDITVRQREAYRLFEIGDYDGCMQILNSEDIDNDFLRARARIKDQDLAVCRKYIREHKTAIDILSSMTGYDERFNEIRERYNKIIPIIFEEKTEASTAFDYLNFLYKQNDNNAVSIADNVLELYQSIDNVNAYEYAELYNSCGVIYSDHGQSEKAEKYCLSAIEIREALVKDNPERFNPDLAMSYNNAGNFYKDQGPPQKAEKYYLSAIEIYEALVKDNPEQFNPDLANSYNNAGVFYDNQGESQKAEKYYLSAIEIYEALVEDNSERFNPDLASSYNNAGNFYKDQGPPQKAEKYCLSAIEIYEYLVKENPERFNPYLAASYNNAGNFYKDQGPPEKAEKYYFGAIKIREALVKSNPERFNPDLASSYNNAGNFYKDQGPPEKAEKYYLSAIEIYEALVKDNPGRFNPDLAMSYYNSGDFYAIQRQPEKAEKYCLSAIEIIEALVKDNPERFNPYLAMSYNNAGNFYAIQRQPEKAEKYFSSAIEIIEAIVKDNPGRFNPYLAVSYYSYGLFTDNGEYFEKALKLAKKCEWDPYCRKIIDALRFYNNSYI